MISASSSTAVSCSASPLYMVGPLGYGSFAEQSSARPANRSLAGAACPRPSQPALTARLAGHPPAGLRSCLALLIVRGGGGGGGFRLDAMTSLIQ